MASMVCSGGICPIYDPFPDIFPHIFQSFAALSYSHIFYYIRCWLPNNVFVYIINNTLITSRNPCSPIDNSFHKSNLQYSLQITNTMNMCNECLYIIVILVTIQRQFINVQYRDASKGVNMVHIGESI